MAPLRERRSDAGCRYAHWLREIEGSAWRAMMSDVGRPLRAGVAPPRATMGEAARCETPLLAGDGAHSLRVLHAARCARLRAASRVAAAFSWWRRRRRRPPLRRVSGDVVTAGLNSFRVWFGPVPGSPRSFRAVMRCRARF
ncbi:RNA Binding protein [Dorcoceras hygrometricum]|uniref:RNA Binding protein n=1 Tax=Dorcoceras hygrometricum TaxID=472368 RepID=A0A2Z7CSY8_9LAMI|nr:RNA Binding protein [Dorcoceras hygrometricum]